MSPRPESPCRFGQPPCTILLTTLLEKLQHPGARDRVTIPVLSMGGWFDNYAESDLDVFSRLSRQNKSVETWIGPWGHDPL